MSGAPVETRSLCDLVELDREHTTFFLCGPGVGECVLIALPEQGWLVIDGAAGGTETPALHVLRRYRGEVDPVDALLLTHPHRDHYRGFVELLDDEAVGPEVRRVGCVARYVQKSTDAIWALVVDAQGRLQQRYRGDAATVVVE